MYDEVLDDGDAAVEDDYGDHIFGAAIYRVCVRDEVSGESGCENRGGVRKIR